MLKKFNLKLIHMALSLLLTILFWACNAELAEYKESEFEDRKIEPSFSLIQTPDTVVQYDSLKVDSIFRYYFSIRSILNYQLRLEVCCKQDRLLTPEEMESFGFEYRWLNAQRTSFNNNHTFTVSKLEPQKEIQFWLTDTLEDTLKFQFFFDVDTSFTLDTLDIDSLQLDSTEILEDAGNE